MKNMKHRINRCRDCDNMKHAVRDLFWMARRYAHGRHTYAPGIIRDWYKKLKEWYPDILIQHDETIEPPKAENVGGICFRSDWLDDCND